MKSFFSLAFLCLFCVTHAERKLQTPALPWVISATVSQNYTAGTFYIKAFAVNVKNISAIAQNVRVSAELSRSKYIQNGTINKDLSIYFAGPSISIVSLGTRMTAGIIHHPTPSNYLTLAPAGQVGNELTVEYYVQYEALSSGYVNLYGAINFAVTVKEDFGAVTSSVFSHSGCNNCAVIIPNGSDSAFTTMLNGGRPF